MKLTRRAESVDRETLVGTFVDVGPLFTLLSSHDHQVVYGRRGTGKTHALSFLASNRTREGDIVAYIDLRNLGSSGGVYSDQNIPVSERATRLLVDALNAVHESLLEAVVENAEEFDLSQAGPLLDRLADAISEVRVVGPVEHSETRTEARAGETQSRFEVGVSSGGPRAGLQIGDRADSSASRQSVTRESGVRRHAVHFGSVRDAIQKLVSLTKSRIWILLDEWSTVPLDLQPYLADLLKRSVIPVGNATVKIAAIEHRTNFQLALERGDYIGLELGSDVAADINLDDFVVFDNDSERARDFFKELLFRHVTALAGDDRGDSPRDAGDLLRNGFTQVNTFDEFVRASEGVPRDAINIILHAAQRALERPISKDDVRVAALNWYHRDKQSAVQAHPRAQELLHMIIDEVIGQRKARAFLLRSDIRHDLIETLFDARVLHLLKRGISSHDEPGVRYNAYKLDYGCYVDLMNTVRAPDGLLPAVSDGKNTYVQVPPDDYRSIRRAILDLESLTEVAKPE